MRPTSFSSSFDPYQFKMGQRESWNSVAVGWKEWWEPIDNGSQKLNHKLVELAEIKSGHRVLDIATGIGESAITAARQVGRKGHVLATDISEKMLSIAKERAASLGLQDIVEFRESDAENLGLPDCSFDAVLCRWGLMFLPNLDAALSKIYTSLVPGGRFVAAVWADPHKVPIINLATRIIVDELRTPPPPPGTPNPFSLSDANKLEKSLVDVGFADVHSNKVTLTFEFASGEDYSRYCQAVSAPARIALSKETEERKIEIWKRVAESAAREHGIDDSLIRMNNESICVIGKKL